MKITELTGKARRHALASERQGEWNGARTFLGEPVTEDVLISYSLMCGSEYDKDGNWIGYYGKGGAVNAEDKVSGRAVQGPAEGQTSRAGQHSGKERPGSKG